MNSSSPLQNLIRLTVIPLPEINGFEVIIYVNEEDFIESNWKGMIGIDPDEILIPETPLAPTEEPHLAVIARCGCGIVECDSMSVRISRVEQAVFWDFRSKKRKESSPGVLRFDLDQYMNELDRAITDKSWESPDRTAARLLRKLVDEDLLSRYRLSWQWASGRSRKDMFTVSLGLAPEPFQVLLHTTWRDESPDEIAQKIADILKRQPSTWQNVEWIPQGENQDALPDIAGPGWMKWSQTVH